MASSPEPLPHCTPTNLALAGTANELTRAAICLLLDIQQMIPDNGNYAFGQGGCVCDKEGTVSVENFQCMSMAVSQQLMARGGKSPDLLAYAKNTTVPGEGLISHIQPKGGKCTIPLFKVIDAGQLKAELKNPKKDFLRKNGLSDQKKLKARAEQLRKISGILDQKCGFVCGFVAEGLRRLGFDDITILTATTKHSRVEVLLDVASVQFYPFAAGTRIVEQHDGAICALTTHAVMVVDGVLIDPTCLQGLPKDTCHVLQTKGPTPIAYATELPDQWESGEWECRPRLGNIELSRTLFGPDTPSRQSTHEYYVLGSLQWFGAQYANQVDPHQAFDLMEEHMHKAVQRIQENPTKMTPADMTVWN